MTIDGEYDPKADIASLRVEGWNSTENLPSELLAMLPERPGATTAA